MSPAEKMLRSLAERSLSSDASSVHTTFSSWDNCMAKAYCKWPVIAGIIIGSLIILAIVGCLVSCLCCGYQCCKGCCGCCYSCCDCGGGSKHHRRDKYADQPSYYQQPPPPQPMNYGYQQPVASPAPPAYRGPRTATFDQPKAVNEDKLPAMPTWADAQTRRVEDHSPVHEAVEMDELEARDHGDTHHYNEGVSSAPGFMSRGGYTEIPGTSTSPRPGPQAMYNNHNDGYIRDGYSQSNRGGLRVTNASYHDLADSEYPNHQPHSPLSSTSPIPGYGGPPSAGFGPVPARAHSPQISPRASPAPYRGFENQPPPKVQVPNFSAVRAYDQIPSPKSPVSPSAGYSPYEHHNPMTATATVTARSPPPPHAAPSPPAAATQYGQYQAFSPSVSSSTPPPPFSESAEHQTQQPGGGDRPPSLLMAGRRPAPNTWKAV